MIRRTLGQIRPQLARVSGTSGFPTDSARIIALLNQATEELMNEGDWPGVVDRYLFHTENGHIILPWFLDRIMGVAVNNIPYSLKSPWYEFVEFGPGPQGDCQWVDSVIDRDEVAIQAQFPSEDDGPWTLYTKCEVDELVDGVRPTMLVKGTTPGGRRVRTLAGTAWVDGEYLELNGDTPPYTFAGTAQFASVTGVVKPETNGYIELWATNGIPADDVLLATYAPQETTPSYHAYFLPTLKDYCGMTTAFYCCNGCGSSEGASSTTDLTVLVRGRKRFIPVQSDSDILIISNLPALIAMMMAIQKREVSDPQGYAAYKLNAIDIMQKEAKSYRGKAKTPALTFQHGASFGAMPYVR